MKAISYQNNLLINLTMSTLQGLIAEP